MARSLYLYNSVFGLYPVLRLNFCACGPAQGRLCAPAQSAFPPSMAVRQLRLGFNLTKKPARAAATTQNTTFSNTNKNGCRSSRLISSQAAGATTQSVVVSQHTHKKAETVLRFFTPPAPLNLSASAAYHHRTDHRHPLGRLVHPYRPWHASFCACHLWRSLFSSFSASVSAVSVRG